METGGKADVLSAQAKVAPRFPAWPPLSACFQLPGNTLADRQFNKAARLRWNK
jgi:hypothetical protein